jgi:autoinducer 2 (AI-2) kinase
MAANYLLTLDAGTSGLRCVIFDRKGRTVSSCRRDYHYIYPPDCAPLGREFAPQELWETVCECIGGAIKSAAIDPAAISGVSATGQREGAVFLDAEGRELYAGPNIDLRAVTDGLALDNQFAGKIFQITGHLPSLMFIPARLIWFRQNRPAEFRKIKTVLALNDWLLFRLCRVRASGICNSIELGLADVGRCCRSPELLTLLDLPESILPEFVPTGTRLGEVTAQAAQESGIRPGPSSVVLLILNAVCWEWALSRPV